MFLACQYGRDARLIVRTAVFISGAFDFFVATGTTEGLPLKTLTEHFAQFLSSSYGCRPPCTTLKAAFPYRPRLRGSVLSDSTCRGCHRFCAKRGHDGPFRLR